MSAQVRLRQLKVFGAAGRGAGFTMVELMVAMVLGLIVVGGAVSVILSNQRSYRTNEALSQVQESARTAFELLARDIRQAGVNGCDSTGRIANVLQGTDWWVTWFGMRGYGGAEVDPAVAFGTAPGTRVAGTDSIHVQGLEGTGLSVETHTPSSANFKLNAASTDIVPNDVLMVCDFDHSAIFKVTNYNSSNVTLVHNTGEGAAVENCSKGLGFPTDCDSTNGNVYMYGPNSQVARFAATAWYIGNNGRADEGGRSLYRRRLASGGVVVSEEVVAGVTDMQIAYRLDGSGEMRGAGELVAADWPNVNAVSIRLTMDSADQRVSTDASINAGRLQRAFTNIVTLRNRVP